MSFTDTIAAVATGGTISAIGIVRISGEKALTAADNIFRARCGTRLADAKDRQMYYGEVFDAGGEVIDLCLCTVSRAPNSYTGEDTSELHCHGSPVVLSEVMRALFSQGVRQAGAGEFTKRAFLNGRMDLTQAEAVIDLIEAETALGAKNAAGQLRGAVCEKMNTVSAKLVDIMAHFHAVIDYPDEDIDEFKLSEYMDVLSECEKDLQGLLATHERGKVLHTGIPAAIVGRTNAGKSTLFNALLGYRRAIVTDIAGTTRDTIEEKVLIGKTLLRLIDTAGLRETEDTVEKLGIERTLAALGGAGLVIAVLDGSEPLCEEDYEVIDAIPAGTPYIVVANKSDLFVRKDLSCSDKAANAQPRKRKDLSSELIINLSAKTGEGIGQLTEELQKLFPDAGNTPPGEILTNARQAAAIGKAAESLKAAREAMTAAVSPDAALMDIEAALTAVGEVTGRTMREDIVNRIFERFCVGK